MSNPDYATLLRQIPGLTGDALADKLAETYQFNEPLTLEEMQLFGYINFGYIDHNPAAGTVVLDPPQTGYPTLQEGDAYVGNYLGSFIEGSNTAVSIDTSEGDDSSRIMLFDNSGVPLVDSLSVPVGLHNINFTLSSINTKLNSIS